MPSGFQAWDTAGNLQVDVTTNMSRVLDMVQTGTAAGSVTHAGFATGTGWWAVLTTIRSDNVVDLRIPDFSLSGNTLSWTPKTGSVCANCWLLFGVY